MRLLLLLAVVAIAAFAVRGWLRSLRAERTPAPGATVRMLPCARCGVYVPEPDAVRSGARAYCSDAHRRADAEGER